MTNSFTLSKLIEANRPDQFILIEHLANTLSQSMVVTDLLIRGSIAAGTMDRISDIDLIIGVQHDHYASFINAIDMLMLNEIGSILPGWRDTIVSNMGGLGYVYLVIYKAQLYQVDLYIVPEGLVTQVKKQTKAYHLYQVSEDQCSITVDDQLSGFIHSELARPLSCSELLVEILVLAHMIKKRISRNQPFIVFSLSTLLLNAVKDLIRTGLAPTSTSWGWYHLEEDVGASSIGRTCLNELSTLINSLPVRTTEELAATMEHVMTIASLIVPSALVVLSNGIEACIYFLEAM